MSDPEDEEPAMEEEEEEELEVEEGDEEQFEEGEEGEELEEGEEGEMEEGEEGEEDLEEGEEEPEEEPEEGEYEEEDDGDVADEFSEERPDASPEGRKSKSSKGGRSSKGPDPEYPTEPESDSDDDALSRRRRKNKLSKAARDPYRFVRDSDDESISSGRDRRGGEPWRTKMDGKTEYNTLANEVRNYSMHRPPGPDGRAHRMEDLPVKLAFEHLSSLAGMSEKVQNAINLSRNLFQRRVDKMEKGVMFKAWRGWLLVQHDFNNKRNILTRAVNKMKRRRLYKAFSKWAELHNKAHRPSHFDKAARAVVLGGCRRRTFGAWREHTKDVRRQFKMAAHTARMREEFLERLVEAGLRQVMHKRIRRAWDAFDKFSEVRRAKRNKARQVIGRAMNREQARAFGRWREYVAQLNKQHGQLKRAVARMSKATMARAFDAWQGQQLHKKRCLMKIIKGTQARAFAKWQDNLRLLRKARIVFARWNQRTRYAAFNGWWLNVEEKRRQTEMCSKICKRILNRAVRNAWAQWMYCVEQSFGCTLEQVKALRDQNARLRRDNERFVRLVDSGEWGRGRVEELSEAGRLLRDERKQLEDLIRSIKDEKDGFVKDAELQAREARALKDRLVSGNFVQRNKLNVRGGSAFNSMQRVLKQDLIDSGAAARQRHMLGGAVHNVDRLAMDKVSVFADGEIQMQAVKRAPPPFARGGARRPAPPPLRAAPPPVPMPRTTAPRPASAPRDEEGENVLVEALSSLTADEVDALEDILKRGRTDAALV
ncbi:predicted protein [Micromonas commoda]|uniref:Sfi1 spindle body domain-containing protein n=1 Tax=Micromonas commoda (strain RCC299 / NOUM17 / CCMP2709) TaxID=296587 RepID=C1E1P0_MICCC|nr:predicted protein [Micromonas commoda]ACO62200.1 predicted protein [Micromonas commoda]|eukprot:XP_002500942.1 predicted protein [Micromonas commoda]